MRSIGRIGLIVWTLVLVASGAQARGDTTWFVDDDACPGPGVGTQLDPFCRIQDGIVNAEAGDTILVRPGIYLENVDFLGKAIHVKSVEGPSETFIRVETGSGVTFRNGEGPGSILEGFTIEGGNGTRLLPGINFGGGIVCETSSPVIRGNVIRENEAVIGPGIACDTLSSPLIEQNLIAENIGLTAGSGYGAGISCTNESSPIVRGNTFLENRGDHGAAIGVESESSPVIELNEMRSNVARSRGSAIYVADGSSAVITQNVLAENATVFASTGAIHALDAASLTIRDNRIVENTGGGITLTGTPSVEIRGNTIEGNTSTDSGGGIHAWQSTVQIIDTVLEDNSCSGDGGGVYLHDSSTFIDRVRIVDNEAMRNGGGLHVQSGGDVAVSNSVIADNLSGLSGGGLSIAEADASFANCTVARNTSEFGGGLHFTNTPGSKRFANGVVWGNAPDEIRTSGVEVDVRHSLVLGGYPAGTDIVDADPMFVSAPSNDYRLRIGSPCVDRGNDEEAFGVRDFEGDPRSVNGDAGPGSATDLGADELLPEVAARFGSVNAAGEGLADVLLIDGEHGDRKRERLLAEDEPFRVEIVPPPAGPDPAGFAMYAWLDRPDPTTLVRQPRRLGVTGFSTFLAGPKIHHPLRTWNNLGHARALGTPDFPSEPAPFVLLDFPNGVRRVVTVTLQGFILDNASTADAPASVTNALVLDVRGDTDTN